jgi:hypothetical protein
VLLTFDLEFRAPLFDLRRRLSPPRLSLALGRSRFRLQLCTLLFELSDVLGPSCGRDILQPLRAAGQIHQLIGKCHSP